MGLPETQTRLAVEGTEVGVGTGVGVGIRQLGISVMGTKVKVCRKASNAALALVSDGV